MKPYKFEPYMKSTLWGGERIAAFKGVSSTETNIGESWELSGVPGHESVTADRGIIDDVDLGLTLTQLIDKRKELLLGKKVYEKFGNKFPLLIKFIDSHQDLSIQVHPNDELAAKRHGCPGKSEMWYIIDSDPGAKIYSGLRRQITPDEYEQMAKAECGEGMDAIMDVIASHESHMGDLFFLPAGRLHSIGAGNFLVEIQQTSDITYRVYDYGRRDAAGNLRELHIDQAKDAINYSVDTEYRMSYDSTKPVSQLIECPYFVTHRVVSPGARRVDFGVDSFVAVVCLWGEANINGVDVKKGDTILVPASENVLYIFGTATFITAYMP